MAYIYQADVWCDYCGMPGKTDECGCHPVMTQLERIVEYLTDRYQFAKDDNDWELAAYYWNGARTANLAQYFKSSDARN